MDPQLDELLAAAAPPVARRTPDLQRTLAALVADAEAAVPSGGRRLARRVGIVSLAAVGVLGVGAAGAAAGFLPVSWFDSPTALHEERVLSSGTACEVTYAARELEDPAHRVRPAARAAAMTAAQAFLHDFDLASISVTDAVAKYEAAQAKVRASREYQALPPDERGPELSPDELELVAVQAELSQRLSAELERRGLSLHVVDVAAGSRCGDERTGR
ncbi:MAG TPA: hypothetical protein VFT00_07085 [Nocardioides sp.]|nr:hypothetical protein [Nocardioides sp.]